MGNPSAAELPEGGCSWASVAMRTYLSTVLKLRATPSNRWNPNWFEPCPCTRCPPQTRTRAHTKHCPIRPRTIDRWEGHCFTLAGLLGAGGIPRSSPASDTPIAPSSPRFIPSEGFALAAPPTPAPPLLAALARFLIGRTAVLWLYRSRV